METYWYASAVFKLFRFFEKVFYSISFTRFFLTVSHSWMFANFCVYYMHIYPSGRLSKMIEKLHIIGNLRHLGVCLYSRLNIILFACNKIIKLIKMYVFFTSSKDCIFNFSLFKDSDYSIWSDEKMIDLYLNKTRLKKKLLANSSHFIEWDSFRKVFSHSKKRNLLIIVCGKNASCVEPYIPPLICGSNYGPNYAQVLNLNDRLTKLYFHRFAFGLRQSLNRYFLDKHNTKYWNLLGYAWLVLVLVFVFHWQKLIFTFRS